MFLRAQMDEEGYVPVIMLAAFNRIAATHTDYPSLCVALKRSEILDFQEENEKVRVRIGWENWLFPNAQGGRGVPLWVKESDLASVDGSDDLSSKASSTSDDQTSVDTSDENDPEGKGAPVSSSSDENEELEGVQESLSSLNVKQQEIA
jgi:hypothetical protein